MSDEREVPEPMDRLHDYFDGQLPAEEKARFERELGADAELRERLRELRELDTALGTLPGHAASADFTARVARAAHARPAGILRLVMPMWRGAARRTVIRVIGAAAALIIVAVSFTGKSEAPAPAEEGYIWESDVETYGSLSLVDLEDQILEELEGT